MLRLHQCTSKLIVKSGIARGLSTLPNFKYRIEDLYDTNYLNIPKLPVPTIDGTLTRYLETVAPLASPAEMEHTKKVTIDFKENLAPKLHAEVLKLDQSNGYPYSYIETFWDEMYQGGRWPVMVNSNPFYVFEDESNPANQDQTARAATLASGALRWWTKVVSGNLEADMERDTPLCMYGFGYVFGTHRVPKIGRDDIVANYHSKHIIVICNHQYFKVDVLNDKGEAISPQNLKSILDNIKVKALGKNATYSDDVGILTSAERDFWANARGRLVTDPINEASMKVIDSSLFGIVLENESLSDDVAKSKCMLTGNDSSNRWFDKHCIIATNDGTLGMNFDHTYGDGMTWNRMVKEVFEDMRGINNNLKPLPAANDSFTGNIESIDWNLSSDTKTDIEKARNDALALIGDVDTYVLKFKEFGRDRMKEMKISPDAAAQLSFQLAYAKVHGGNNAAVYEACAMKNYFHGRTETIRACSSDSVAMVSAFLNGADDETKRNSLRAAAATHINIAKGAKACGGPFQGVDRHLYAMKNIAARLGVSHPFFEDPLYARTSTWVLSTSNVTHPFVENFGFGAVTGAGYGLGYMLFKDNVPINITSYNSCSETSSRKMGEAIAESLNDFNKLF